MPVCTVFALSRVTTEAKIEVLDSKSKRIFGNIAENVYIWGSHKRKTTFSFYFSKTYVESLSNHRQNRAVWQ